MDRKQAEEITKNRAETFETIYWRARGFCEGSDYEKKRLSEMRDVDIRKAAESVDKDRNINNNSGDDDDSFNRLGHRNKLDHKPGDKSDNSKHKQKH
jgi:hypothetical protein